MRFGQIGGWMDPKANFAFGFYLDRPDGSDLVIQRGRMEASTPKPESPVEPNVQGQPTDQRSLGLRAPARLHRDHLHHFPLLKCA